MEQIKPELRKSQEPIDEDVEMAYEKNEPDFIELRKQEMIDQVQKQRIQVTEKEGGSVVDVQTGQEAYFALLAREMLEVASKYGKDVHQIHKLFYGVSCNYDRLIKFLEMEKKDIKTITPDQL